MEASLSVLGPLTLTVDGEPISLRPAQRRVLATIASLGGGAIETDVLIERMWPESPPKNARASLHVHISGIRRAAPNIIQTESSRYRLHPDVALDIKSFQSLIDEAKLLLAEDDWDAVLDCSDAALSLWRQDPFAELSDDVSAQAEIVRLWEQYLEIVELRMRVLLALGRGSDALPELRTCVLSHPLHERFRYHLMLALYQSGRQVEALRTYEEFRTMLGDEVGIEPDPSLRLLEERILLQDPALGDPIHITVPNNLPVIATSFIGRETAVQEITAGLATSGLVTIVGGPGFGKTRLAVEVGQAVIEDYPGGVWLAHLGGATTAMSVAATIATATRTTERITSIEQLGSLLRRRPILIVLDDCEHVVEHIRRFLTSLVTGRTTARVLATSRRALNLDNEQVLDLGSRPMEKHAAIQLMVDRVRSVDRSFTPTKGVMDALTELCASLEGIPLGIELVARWIPTLGIQNTTRLLHTVASESPLEAAFDRSHRLLQTADQSLLVRLSVFSAPFTLERAHDVCSEPDVPEMATAGGVARLVDASLLTVRRSGDGSVRYRMLEPIREFAASRADGAIDLTADLARSFLNTAKEVATAAQREDQSSVFAAVDVEIADYRSVMSALVAADDWNRVTEMAADLTHYWYARFLAWEGCSWLDSALEHDLSETATMRALLGAGFLAWAAHDYDLADQRYETCLETSRYLDDRKTTAEALYGLGLIHQKRRFKDGAGMLDEAADIYRTLPGCSVELGQCLLFRGLDEVSSGNVYDGTTLLEQASTLLGEAGHRRQVSKASRWLAHADWLRGDEIGARAHIAEAERIARATGDQPALSGALVERAFVEVRWGELPDAAAVLLEALEPIPHKDLIDICQILLPTAWLASAVGNDKLAGQILSYMDDVYEEAGWLPQNSRAAVRMLEEHVDRIPLDGIDVVLVVRDLLSELSAAEER